MKIQNLDLLKICLIAISVRLIWALLIPVIPLSDSHAYDTFAQNIWLHGTYGWTEGAPTSYWPVGTSAIYSVFYSFFGHSYWPIIFFNILCTVGIIYFSQRLCDRFFGATDVGRYVALIISFWPTLIFFTTVLASELPYMCASMAAIYYFTSSNSKIIKSSMLGGLLFALAYYIRPLASITLAICILYLLVNKQDIKTVLLRSFICITIIVLLVAPWAYRNYQLYDNVVIMSTNGGATLWMGNQPDTPGGYLPLPDYVKGLDEYTRNKVLKEKAVTYIKENPVEFITRTAMKFIKFHTKETIGVTWNEKGIKKTFSDSAIVPLKGISQLYWSCVLLLGVIGLIHYGSKRGLWRLCFHPYTLIWLSTAGVHAIIVSQDRYHLPLIPIISAFAAYFIVKFKQSKMSSTRV